MASGEEQPPKRYYSVLGLGSDASACAIRSAFRKLAMKWHPDKCSGQDRAEAKAKFQEIQEAYAVLSDERKKMLYDNGLYNPEDDDDDIEGLSSFINELSGMMTEVKASEGLSSFINELSGMMTEVKASEEARKGSSFEELQQLFVSMFSADLAAFNDPSPPSTASINFDKKRGWHHDTSPFFGSCIVEDSVYSPQTHFFFSDAFHYCSSVDSSASKKTKSMLYGNPATSGSHAKQCDNRFNNQRARGM